MSNKIQQIKEAARNAAKNSVDIGINYATWKRLLINGSHRGLNESTVPRRLYGNRLGLRKREQIADQIRAANNGLLIKKHSTCTICHESYEVEFIEESCPHCGAGFSSQIFADFRKSEVEKYCEDDHDWKEDYYGYQCQKCPMFYAFGCAPWEWSEEAEAEAAREEYFETNGYCDGCGGEYGDGYSCCTCDDLENDKDDEDTYPWCGNFDEE